MKLDIIGRAFIQSREGLKLTAYPDIKGVPTIGYGTTVYPTGKRVKLGDHCTQEQADIYFSSDVKAFEDAVNDHVNTELLTQNQFNALVSLVYNIGESGFQDSTICRVVNTPLRLGNHDDVLNAFMMWTKVRIKGKLVFSEGLSNRRKKEVELYFS